MQAGRLLLLRRHPCGVHSGPCHPPRLRWLAPFPRAPGRIGRCIAASLLLGLWVIGESRAPREMRETAHEWGVSGQSDGSARFSQGLSSAVAVVRGPTAPPRAPSAVDASAASVQIVFTPASGVLEELPLSGSGGGGGGGADTASITEHVRRVVHTVCLLQELPRQHITVALQDENNDGSMLATVTNAAVLALIDAGIPMQHTAATASVVLMEDGGFCEDPTAAQEREARAMLTVTAIPRPPQTVETVDDDKGDIAPVVVATSCVGPMSLDEYEEGLRLVVAECESILTVMRGSLTAKATGQASTAR